MGGLTWRTNPGRASVDAASCCSHSSSAVYIGTNVGPSELGDGDTIEVIVHWGGE